MSGVNLDLVQRNCGLNGRELIAKFMSVLPPNWYLSQIIVADGNPVQKHLAERTFTVLGTEDSDLKKISDLLRLLQPVKGYRLVLGPKMENWTVTLEEIVSIHADR